MKKLLTTIAAAALCTTMLSVQSFADNVPAIYAADAQSIADRVNKTIPDDFGISVKPDTIMPVYSTSIYDYAKTGKLKFEKNTYDGVQVYFADVANAEGKFAGTVMFTADGATPGILIEAPRDDESLAIDYRANAGRINELMSKNGLSTNITDAKFVFAEGLGYVYYINNGTEEMFVAANFKGTNGYYFTEENGGIVIVNKDLTAKVKAEQSNQTGEGISEPGTNPPTAGAENPPTAGGDANPDTGSTGMVLSLGTAIAACGVIISSKKRGKQ